MILVAAALLAAATPSPATPQVAASTAAPARHKADARSIAAAQKLMDASGYDKLIHDTLDALIASQRAEITAGIKEQMGDEVDNALAQKIARFIEDETRAMFRENDRRMRDAYAALYASYFTAEELERLAVIQSDPLMKKANLILPSMLTEVSTLIDGIAKKHGEGMEERLQKVVSDHLERNDS